MLARLYVLLFPLIVYCQGLHLDLKWLNQSILNLLEDKTYCQLSIDLPDFDLDFPIEGDQYISFNQAECSSALIIKDLQSIGFGECDQRNHFVKNPQITYFFFNSKPYEDLKILFQSCVVMKDQPYFFILTKIDSQLVIEEVQVYAQKIITVVEWVDL